MNGNLSKETKNNDDFQLIDFTYIISFFSRFKYLFVTFIFFGIFAGAVFLNFATYTYTVSINLVPVTTTSSQNTSLPSSVGIITNILGVPSVDNENRNFKLYKVVLFSNLLAKELSKDIYFLKLMFGDAYNYEENKLKSYPDSHINKLKKFIKKVLGIPVFNNTLSVENVIKDFIRDNLKIEDNKGLISSLYTQTEKPKITKKLLLKIHETADNIIRKKSILRTSRYEDFLVSKLKENLTQDQRNSLIESLKQNQKVLLSASSGLPFSAELFEDPIASTHPTKPIPTVVLFFSILMSVIFSLIVGILIVLFRNK